LGDVVWDPAVYGRFGAERGRPFADLVARIDAPAPRAVVDLGCGPGELTATLAGRWPGAAVTGIDSSPEMIERAAALGAPVDFRVGDIADFTPAPDVDVLISNAALQWVPGHERLLSGWARRLDPGAWIAVQVPGNFDAPSHRALRAVGADPRFVGAVAPLLRSAPVNDAIGYAALLTDTGCAVDAWETTYVHRLTDDADEHPVLRWMDGTALRPVRAALDAASYAAFRAELGGRLAGEYPARQGRVYFPFRRIFVVARRC
jgi:trans-aconitate 2-methyltransferase